jgi:multiple sugar transport system ATP-binding protein
MAERIAVMNFGVLQQVGAFEEVYNHPVNEFVAGFIGEPPMNFLSCLPVVEGDAIFLTAADASVKVRLPDALRAKIERAGAQKIDLGIRPVHLEVVAPSESGASEVRGTVHTYESLGEEGQLAATIGTTTVLVVTPPDLRLKRGDAVTLRPRADHLHLFDAATQAAL